MVTNTAQDILIRMSFPSSTNLEDIGKGFRMSPHPHVPLWYVDYFSLKTKARKTQKEPSTSPLTASKNSDRGPGPERERSPETTTAGLGRVWQAVGGSAQPVIPIPVSHGLCRTRQLSVHQTCALPISCEFSSFPRSPRLLPPSP